MKKVEQMQENSQVMQVYNHLKKHGSITTLEAFRLYMVTRLSAHIFVLRHEYGMPIRGEMVKSKSGNVMRRYKKYYLEDK